MMTQGVENLQLWRLLGVESELVCSILRNSCCRFVAGVAVTYGNRGSDINVIFSGSPIPENVVAILENITVTIDNIDYVNGIGNGSCEQSNVYAHSVL